MGLVTTVGFAVLAVLVSRSSAAVEENGVLGDPYVNCGGDSIDVRFDTRNTFHGTVFVKGQLEWPECRSAPIDASGPATRNASIQLNFKDCSLERRRSTNPRGIFISTTLVVAFAPEILTKYDRVYTVQCFYMEMQKQLEKEITVNMPTPPLQTQQVPMPTCRYEVLNGGPEGAPVFFATIGQMVYHKWTCDSQTENQFCMIVHSCTVDDGNGDRVELIDNQGCAKDKFLLSNLDYVSDLMVGKEAHVYKYADRQQMFFDCQISLSVKEPGHEFCDVPNCPDPPRRRRRDTNAAAANSVVDADSPQQSTTTEEIPEKAEVEAEIAAQPEKVVIGVVKEAPMEKAKAKSSPQSFTIPNELIRRETYLHQNYRNIEDNVCMSGVGAALVIGGNLLMAGTSVTLFYTGLRKISP